MVKSKKDKKNPLLPPIGEKNFSPMGASDFANMPAEPKFMTFSKKNDHRSGVINSFTYDIEDISKIDENKDQYWRKEAYGDAAPR